MDNLKVAIISVVGTILCVIVGGAISSVTSWLQLKQQVKLRKDDRQIENYEKIYRLLTEIFHKLSALTEEYVKFLKTQKPLTIDRKDIIPIGELRMLVNFYVPELKEIIDLFDKEWAEYGNVLIEALSPKQVTQLQKNAYVNKLLESSIALSNHAEEAKIKLSQIVKKII